MPLFRDEEYLRVDFEEKQEKDEALWVKCKSCGKLIFKKKLQENNHICPNCGAYFFLTAKERIKTLVDSESFVDETRRIESDDPLGFIDVKPYEQRVNEAQKETGMFDAIIAGTAEIESMSLVLAVMDFRFIGGSMGSVVGEQIVNGIELAAEKKFPFVLVSSSGGARMQEGLLSLLQMVKTTSARNLLDREGLPFISIMTYPTTAGVEASVASLGDIILAEKGALIGFAGRNVIEKTIGEELPPDFQSSQFAYDHGMVDAVVERDNLRSELSEVLKFF